MNKKGVGAIELMVGLIILVVIGIGVVGDLVTGVTTYPQVTNETVTMTQNSGSGYNGTITLAHKPVIAGTYSISNTTKLLTETTNYIFNTDAGTARIITNYTSAALNITYKYQPAGYLQSSTARTVAGLIVVFIGIGALVLVTKEVGLQ